MNDKNIQNEFISTISHEIRTPLTSINGFSKTMLENWDELDVAQKKKFLKIINEQAQRLINMVENVLNVAKMEGSTGNFGTPVLKEVNLEIVVKKALELIKHNFPVHNFVVHPPKLPLISLCDADFLQQILVNLLENACKYSQPTSKIEILFSVKSNATGDFNLITVKDAGCGIKKESLGKVFDKFYRVDDALTSPTQGSGLGLYIAQTLAKKMGGKIEAESNIENGNCKETRFTAYLPVFEIEKHIKGHKSSGGGYV